MTRDVVTAFTDKTFSPEHRIFIIWRWFFFLRLWRDWLPKNGFSIADNCITSNAYFCIEINAHTLILLIILLRDSKQDHLFLIWLFNSQGCESFFRLARSMTTTESTVINFTMLQFLYRVRRIEFQAMVETELGHKFSFPSSHRASRAGHQEPVLHKLPDNCVIEECIVRAKEFALLKAKELGMVYNDIPDLNFNLQSFNFEEEEDDGAVINLEDTFDSNEREVEEPYEEEALNDREDEDLEEDLCIISSGAVGVKTFHDVSISPNSIFVRVQDGFENPVIIKKLTLCRLFTEVGTRLSSDRVLRYKTPEGITRSKSPDCGTVHHDEEVFEDDWCVFSTADKKSFLIGKVLAFAHLSGRTLKELQYMKKSASTKRSDKAIGCLCSWYALKGNTVLAPDFTYSQGYHSIEFYVCTIPRPSISNRKISLPRNIGEEIKTFFRVFKQGKK